MGHKMLWALLVRALTVELGTQMTEAEAEEPVKPEILMPPMRAVTELPRLAFGELLLPLVKMLAVFTTSLEAEGAVTMEQEQACPILVVTAVGEQALRVQALERTVMQTRVEAEAVPKTVLPVVAAQEL